MINVDDNKRTEAISRFHSLAGLSKSDSAVVVDAALQAALEQTLDIIVGSAAVPSTITAARADELRYVCIQRGRLFTQREVEVLFRTTPANARSILTTMRATYENALRTQFIEQMRRAAVVVSAGSRDQGMKWRVSFPTQAPYDTIRAELERLGFLDKATFDDANRTVELERLSGERRSSEVDILQALGLERPKGVTGCERR